jgi:lysozyme
LRGVVLFHEYAQTAPTKGDTMLDTVLDLSHNNTLTPNSFHQFKTAGIQAVIHKATQGTGMVDICFADRKARAAAVGILFGAYHFADRGDPVAQADHFISVTQGCHLRVLDWETTDMTYSGAVAFVNRIKQVCGHYPLLYSGQAFLAVQILTQGITTPDTTTLSKCGLWLARYSTKAPDVPKAWPAGFTLWQHTSTSTIPGVVGNVDRSYFNGDSAALKALFS